MNLIQFNAHANPTPHCREPSFPDSYTIDYEHKVILKDGKPFFHGIPLIEGFYDLINDRGDTIKIVKLVFMCQNGWNDHAKIRPPNLQEEIVNMLDATMGTTCSEDDFDGCMVILLNDLIRNKLTDSFFDYVIPHQSISCKVKKLICSSIIQTIFDSECLTKGYLLHQGYNFINGRVIYLAGDILINGAPNGCYFYEPTYKLKEFVYDEDSKNFIRKYLEKTDLPPILLIFIVSALIRPFVPKEDRNDCDYMLYLLGPSGSGKSWIMKLLVGIFYTDEFDNYNIMQLSSKLDDIIKRHNTVEDFCVVTDDYHKNEYNQGVKNGQYVVEEIIGSINVAGDSQYNGNNRKLKPICGCTAEDLIMKTNKINRSAVVNMKCNMKPKVKYYLQEHKKNYIGLLVHFIGWICQHRNDVEYIIEKRFKTFKMSFKDSDLYEGGYRILQTQRFLLAAADVFNTYMFPDKPDDELLMFDPCSYKTQMIESINECIEYTLSLVKIKSTDDHDPEKLRVVKIIVEAFDEYSTDEFCLFKNAIKKDYPKHNYIFKSNSNIWLITNKHLLQLVCDENHDYNKDSLLLKLEKWGLIEIKVNSKGCTERTFKISGCSKRVIKIKNDEIERIRKIGNF